MYLLSSCAVAILFVSFRAFPEFKVNSEFITTHLQKALNLDAKLSSHPIEVECPDANRIGQVSILRLNCRTTANKFGDQIFDSLSYSKAASGSSYLISTDN
jgi:aminopeptidase 2